jgi:hypothetical protein
MATVQAQTDLEAASQPLLEPHGGFREAFHDGAPGVTAGQLS